MSVALLIQFNPWDLTPLLLDNEYVYMLLLRLLFFLSNWGYDCHAVVHKEGRYLDNLMYLEMSSADKCTYIHTPLTATYLCSFSCYTFLAIIDTARCTNIWECKMREERTVLLFLSHFHHHHQQQQHHNVYTKQCVKIHLTNILYITIIAYSNFFILF